MAPQPKALRLADKGSDFKSEVANHRTPGREEECMTTTSASDNGLAAAINIVLMKNDRSCRESLQTKDSGTAAQTVCKSGEVVKGFTSSHLPTLAKEAVSSAAHSSQQDNGYSRPTGPSHSTVCTTQEVGYSTPPAATGSADTHTRQPPATGSTKAQPPAASSAEAHTRHVLLTDRATGQVEELTPISSPAADSLPSLGEILAEPPSAGGSPQAAPRGPEPSMLQKSLYEDLKCPLALPEWLVAGMVRVQCMAAHTHQPPLKKKKREKQMLCKLSLTFNCVSPPHYSSIQWSQTSKTKAICL